MGNVAVVAARIRVIDPPINNPQHQSGIGEIRGEEKEREEERKREREKKRGKKKKKRKEKWRRGLS